MAKKATQTQASDKDDIGSEIDGHAKAESPKGDETQSQPHDALMEASQTQQESQGGTQEEKTGDPTGEPVKPLLGAPVTQDNDRPPVPMSQVGEPVGPVRPVASPANKPRKFRIFPGMQVGAWKGSTEKVYTFEQLNLPESSIQRLIHVVGAMEEIES